MSDIKWKDGAVCYAFGKQQYSCSNLQNFLTASDFKLNEILSGDYLLVQVLKVEQEYNNIVEVFGLFGFRVPRNKNYFDIKGCEVLKAFSDFVVPDVLLTASCKRQLTYHQIIAIGKLKRMMLERAKSGAVSGADLTQDKHKSAVDYLTECAEVQKQRGEQYDSSGTGERSFSACADAYNAITGGNLKGSDICLILQILKDVRQYSNPLRLHEDSVLDKVSYSSLHAEELNKELK